MALTNEEAVTRSDALYEKYVQPLEAEHWGKFVAVAPGGKTIVGHEKADVLDKALLEFGEGVTVFKIGPEEVYRMRSPVQAKMICKSGCAGSSIKHAFDNFEIFYEKYRKPLEAEHWGKVIAIATNSRRLLGTDVYEVEDEASDTLSDCFVLFKVGLMPVGRI